MIRRLFTAIQFPTRSDSWASVEDKTWRLLGYASILVTGVLMLATFRDYGITFDEETQRVYGDKVLAWYLSLFRDRRAVDLTFIYGGFFDATAQAAARILPFGVFESRHLINCLFGLLAVAIAYKFGDHLGGSSAGFFSALFLILTPVMYGHSFNNPKDIPFATLCLLALYFIVTSYRHLPRLPMKAVIGIGVSIGLAMGVRVGGIILFGYLAVMLLAWLLVQFRLGSAVVGKRGGTEERVDMQPASQGSLKNTVFALVRSFALVVVIGWLVMLACWPWAQVKPLISPFRALVAFTGYETGIRSFFNGRYTVPADLPWHYLPTWFSVSLPEFYFVSLLTGCAVAVASASRFRQDATHFERLVKVLMLIQAAAVPIAIAILLRSPLYDAQRHFLFTIPPLTVIAGISFAAFLKTKINWIVKTTVSLLIAFSLGLTAVDMVQLHPYQYLFFNRAFGGGLKSASRRFDTDYWGNSYKEGADWVIRNYRPDTQEKIRVAACSDTEVMPYYFKTSEEVTARFQPVGRDDDPHVFLANTRYRCHKKKILKGKVLHIVERQGVPLLYVIEFHRS